MCTPRSKSPPTTTMPPRAVMQTTLDAVFSVKSKRSAAEIAAAAGSTPAKKRRKVSERYPRGVHSSTLSTTTDSCDAPIVKR